MSGSAIIMRMISSCKGGLEHNQRLNEQAWHRRMNYENFDASHRHEIRPLQVVEKQDQRMTLGRDRADELAEHELEPVAGPDPLDAGPRGRSRLLRDRGGDAAVGHPLPQVGQDLQKDAVAPGADGVVDAPLHGHEPVVPRAGREDVPEEGVQGRGQNRVGVGVLVELPGARKACKWKRVGGGLEPDAERDREVRKQASPTFPSMKQPFKSASGFLI